MANNVLSMLPQPLVKTDRLGDPFVVAGDRAYLIGRQDGSFPAMGEHIHGEMGGLWAHPHKLLDGFWCAVAPLDEQIAPGELPCPAWLPAATRFEGAAWGVTQWFDLPDLDLCIRRAMAVPDARPALLVDLHVENRRDRPRKLELTLLCRADLRPGWLDPRPDGEDHAVLAADGATVVASDPMGPWWVAWGSAAQPVETQMGADLPAPEAASNHGIAVLQRYRITVSSRGETRLRLGVHGSTAGAEEAAAALRDLLRDADALMQAKKERLAAALAVSRLDVPDDAIVRAWGWTCCAYDWLAREVPGVGRGLGAGLPEFPWWFSCDTAYALRGLLPLGGFDLAEQTLRLLAATSQRHNRQSGRIIHELSCTGRVFNPGNTQETPQFACAILETYLWSGQRALIDDLYPLCRQGVLSWTLGACDRDGDLLPEGYGITEVGGLDNELIDSAVWTHEGLRALRRMAAIVGDAATAARCAELAPRLREAIERRFWQDGEGLYADWIATPRQARERLQQMLEQARRPGHAASAAMSERLEMLLERAAALPPDEETVWPLANAVVITPLEAGLASRTHAERAFARLEGPEFSGPDGVYLSGLARDRAMSISTGYLAAAQCAYGRIEQAVRSSRLLAAMATVRTPGAISEMSPDGGCFVQAWSGYGVVHPIVSGVFGLFPDAAARRLVLCPRLPTGWPYARLRNVRVGDAHLDVTLQRDDAGDTRCHLLIDQPGWQATIVAPSDTLPPLTLLGVHAAADVDRWGVAREIEAAAR